MMYYLNMLNYCKQNIQEMFNGEPLPAHVASSNAYLGAVAIVMPWIWAQIL